MVDRLDEGGIVDGRYRVISRLGSGGMADVYCAEDLQLGRKIALKLLYRRFAQDADFVERFRREASAAAGLQHPNVVAVYDRGEWDGQAYIAMENVEGRTLKQLVQAEGPLPPARAVALTQQILRAARFAHKRGIIHRDLKPHNVIVDAEDRAKVTDFGIARAGASDMTETGSIMGTAQYLSPEQAQGLPVSAASDVYSVGIILFELLTGRVPFDADSAVAVALKQVSEIPPAPSSLVSGISPALDAVVARALAKEPAQRFADADDFLTALEYVDAAHPDGTTVFAATAPTTAAPLAATAYAAAAAPTVPVTTYEELYPSTAPPEPVPRERGNGWWWALLAGLLVAAIVVGALLLTGGTKQVTVPAVVGLQQADAQARLKQAGLASDATTRTSKQPKGTVIRQSPTDGRKADKGSTVDLVVSDGPGNGRIPALRGMPRSVAVKALEDAGYVVQETRQSSDTIGRNRVIATSPPEGSQLERQQTVTLVISSGAPLVAVPGVVGQDVASARAALTSAGFTVAVTEQDSADQAPGTVLAQGVKAGTRAAKGSRVTLTVAKAPAVAVPDVKGQNQTTAAAALIDAGLKPEIRTIDVLDPAKDGQVRRQSPAAGRKVKRGATVTLTVGKLTTTSTTTSTSTTPTDPSALPVEPGTG